MRSSFRRPVADNSFTRKTVLRVTVLVKINVVVTVGEFEDS
jgi:hypothetical protein